MFAPEIKWNVAGNVLLTGNVLASIANKGLRANVIPVVGFDWAFSSTLLDPEVDFGQFLHSAQIVRARHEEMGGKDLRDHHAHERQRRQMRAPLVPSRRCGSRSIRVTAFTPVECWRSGRVRTGELWIAINR